MSKHVNAIVKLTNRDVRLRADGKFEAMPQFGFPYETEHPVGSKVNGRFANMIFRPDGTYDIEFLDES